jgi:hypothetical protein
MEAETEEDYAEREWRAKNAATVRKMLPGTLFTSQHPANEKLNLKNSGAF